MRSPQDWLASQTADRPDDFAPEEQAPALAFIAAVQRDAIESAIKECEAATSIALANGGIITAGASMILANSIRALIPGKP